MDGVDGVAGWRDGEMEGWRGGQCGGVAMRQTVWTVWMG